MLTLGQVLNYLNDEADTRKNDYAEAAYTAIEEVVGAIAECGGDLENHLAQDGSTVNDTWNQLVDYAPHNNELVVVARADDVYADGPINGFVARYVQDSGVNGWEVTDEDGQKVIRPGYNDDEWKRI